MAAKGSPRKTFDLAEVIKDELEKNQPIAIKLGEATILVPRPIFWPDEVFVLTNEGDDVGAAQAILGDDYAAFSAAGGTCRLLFTIIRQANGATVPE